MRAHLRQHHALSFSMPLAPNADKGTTMCGLAADELLKDLPQVKVAVRLQHVGLRRKWWVLWKKNNVLAAPSLHTIPSLPAALTKSA